MAHGKHSHCSPSGCRAAVDLMQRVVAAGEMSCLDNDPRLAVCSPEGYTLTAQPILYAVAAIVLLGRESGLMQAVAAISPLGDLSGLGSWLGVWQGSEFRA